MNWTPLIKRGSTFRVPASVIDESGAPTSFSDTVFTITPNVGSPIELSPVNGKLTITSFVWKERWWKDTSYTAGDVVLYKGKLWQALQANTNHAPITGEDWKLFSTFEFLISSSETAGYSWSKGTFNWSVVRSNGDEEGSYLTGDVVVDD